MTSVALNFVGGIPFQLLYDSVQMAIHKTRKFKTHLKSLQFTLDSLEPLIIEQIGDNNVQLNLPNNIIEGLQTKMEEGKDLVDMLLKLSMWNIRIWGNCYNCIRPNYAEQLGELDRSLRILTGQLEWEQRRTITELLILGRNTRDKQDELDKKLEKIYDILMAPNNATGRIVWNSVQPVASSSGGGAAPAPAPAPALGVVFQQLFDVVIRVKVKNMTFKRLLKRFESTLYCSQPLIEEISKCNKVLHLPKEQVEYFVGQIQNGVELVHKFSKVHKRANYDKCTYTKRILNLNDTLQRLFIRLKGQVERDVKEAMDSANKIEAVIKKIEGGGWAQNNEFGSEGQSRRLPTIGFGLDVHNRQGPWDVNKETLVDSARITEEGVKPIEGSDAVQNQMETQGSCEVPPSPAVGLDVLNMQGPSDVIEETLLDLARVKQEMIKPIEGSYVLQNQIETDSSCEVLPREAETLDSITRNIEVGVMETEGTEVVVSTRDVQETMKGTLEIAVAETDQPPSPTVGLDVHGTTDQQLQHSQQSHTKWKSEAQQQIYSSKLLQALNQVSVQPTNHSSSFTTCPPRRGRAGREAARTHGTRNQQLQHSQQSHTNWKSKAQQQIYSFKLLQALKQIYVQPTNHSSSSSTCPPRRVRAMLEAADRVLAVAAKGRTRWSRAILTNRLKLKFRQHKKQQRASAAGTWTGRLKKKKFSVKQRKVRVLGRLVPGCRKQPSPVILEEATDYIAALEMQVRAMSQLTQLLSVSGSTSGAGGSTSSPPPS